MKDVITCIILKLWAVTALATPVLVQILVSTTMRVSMARLLVAMVILASPSAAKPPTTVPALICLSTFVGESHDHIWYSEKSNCNTANKERKGTEQEEKKRCVIIDIGNPPLQT
jgi:hypothetical protein